ncbi:translation initiation factor IF-2 [Peromyscus eremicus]|uniref:translation initiation factor IF-2 n=1 Tax=Peromyscus eremicus TaxID=42410 RepID=UPI0027DCA78A|nr:translation initiation factor IF-2 [Peromyscus eremicus]
MVETSRTVQKCTPSFDAVVRAARPCHSRLAQEGGARGYRLTLDKSSKPNTPARAGRGLRLTVVGQTHRWRSSLGSYTLTSKQPLRLVASARGPGVGPGRLPEGAGSPRRRRGRRRCAQRRRGGDGSPHTLLGGLCAESPREGSGRGTGWLARGGSPRGLNLPRAGRAGRGGARERGGAGLVRPGQGRGEGCSAARPGTLPPPYLSPAPPDRRLRGRGLLEDNGRPLSPSQSPLPPGCGFSQSQSLPGVGFGGLLGTKKSGWGCSLQRGGSPPPRSVAARTVREDNRTPPAPRTLVLTLVSPPLPALPSPSSSAGVRRRGRGPAVNKGHLTASPQLGHSSPGDPLSCCSSREGREGEGRVLSTCCSLPPRRKLSSKPGARIIGRAGETRGWRLGPRGTRRNADAAGNNRRVGMWPCQHLELPGL